MHGQCPHLPSGRVPLIVVGVLLSLLGAEVLLLAVT